MRKIIILLASAALLSSTAACQMFKGLGQDVQDTAEAADKAV